MKLQEELQKLKKKRKEPNVKVSNQSALTDLISGDQIKTTKPSYSNYIRKRAEEKRNKHLDSIDSRLISKEGSDDIFLKRNFNSQILLNRAAEQVSNKHESSQKLKIPPIRPQKRDFILRLNKSVPQLSDYSSGMTPQSGVPIRPRDKHLLHSQQLLKLSGPRLKPINF